MNPVGLQQKTKSEIKLWCGIIFLQKLLRLSIGPYAGITLFRLQQYRCCHIQQRIQIWSLETSCMLTVDKWLHTQLFWCIVNHELKTACTWTLIIDLTTTGNKLDMNVQTWYFPCLRQLLYLVTIYTIKVINIVHCISLVFLLVLQS